MKQFLVLNDKNAIVSKPFTSIGLARGTAYELAMENIGVGYHVHSYETETGTMSKTSHSYMGQRILPPVFGELVGALDDYLRG